MNYPNFDLTGCVALITGAGRGIGLGMAQALAAAGCAVAIQDIEENVAREEAEKIVSEGGRAIGLGGDLTDTSIAATLVQQTREQLGGLHILVNNGAIQIGKSWLEMSIEEIDRQFHADQIMPWLLAREAEPIFREQQWGRIINLGSVQGRGGNPNMLAYSMSKAALENFTKALARHFTPFNTTVNMLSPGYFNTWRNRGDFKNEEDLEQRGKWVPVGRIGEPEDCAGIALLLCSEAGGYITGQNIYVDGGITIRSI